MEYRRVAVDSCLVAVLFAALFLAVTSPAPECLAGTAGTPVSTCSELQEMQADPAADFHLTNDIDCSETSGWNGGLGWEPVGSGETPFTGTLDGNGYEVSGLFCARGDYAGLFGYVAAGFAVTGVNLENVNLTGGYGAGGLVGRSELGSLD